MRKRNLILPLFLGSFFFTSNVDSSVIDLYETKSKSDFLIAGGDCGGSGSGGGMSPAERKKRKERQQKVKDAAKKRIIKSKRAAGKSLTDEEKKIICTSGDDCNFEIDFFDDDNSYSYFLIAEEKTKKYLIANNIFSPSIWNIFQNYRYEIVQEYINKKKHPNFIGETGYTLLNESELFGSGPLIDDLPKFEPYTHEKYMNTFNPLFDDERKFSSVLFRAFAENREKLSKDIIGSEAMGFTFSEIENLLSSIINNPFINQKL